MKRVAVLAGIIAAMVAIAAPQSAAANSVDATCNDGSCVPWFNTDVTVAWDFSPSTPDVTSSDCGVTSVTTEGESALDCTATWNDPPPGETEDHAITVRIDKTSPTDVAGAPDRPPDHNGWYNHALSVPFSGTDALSGISTCTAVPYSGPDGSAISVMGGCTDNATNTTSAASSAFNYDATPPSVTGATADRPPDHDGWYNHPVSFTFQGTDATSGIAGCTTATYSGPVDPTASVAGACTDNAGNAASGAQSFKYDDARPAAARVEVIPGNHSVDVSWTVPGDAAGVTVSRSPQSGGAPAAIVYSGSASSFLDTGLKNGVKYRYAVTDQDQAGNTTTTVIRAIPTGSSLRPFVGTVVGAPPLLTWKKIKGARYYNLQLFFGGKKVLSIWPRTAQVQLKPRWHFRGKTYALATGHYRWYVWPGFGPPSAHRYGKRIGRSSFRVTG
ncbi:MAG TPA: hypothetical protein VF032_13985 [Thermoleophilaceae bacterium]